MTTTDSHTNEPGPTFAPGPLADAGAAEPSAAEGLPGDTTVFAAVPAEALPAEPAATEPLATDTVVFAAVPAEPLPADTVVLDAVRPEPRPRAGWLSRLERLPLRPRPHAAAHRSDAPRDTDTETETDTDRAGTGDGGRVAPGRTQRVLHGTGEVLITFGLIILFFAAYEIWGKAVIISHHQSQLDAQLDALWAADPTVSGTGSGQGDGSGASVDTLAPPPGGSLGRLYLPRLGMHWVMVEGVTTADLAYGPGHYPGTALPGQVGNFSVAGHRIPSVFWDLDEVRDGDDIIVETRDSYFIYQVVSQEIVAPTAVEVIAPVPDQPGATATQAMLTLTTCNPKWDNYQRLIVHASLVRSQPHSAGIPPELGA